MIENQWYKTAKRWGQTNLVEIDPERYDADWWVEHWRRTKIQGVVVNAGGIVAYYPSDFPLHRRAIKLGSRDLFGEIVLLARREGLKVIARMDSNRVAQEFFEAHPEWICVDRGGEPYRVADKFVTCINSPYYSEYLPQIIEEIIRRSKPDGFSDNSWAGMPRENICYCQYCQEGFSNFSDGVKLPDTADWTNAAYRKWIRWNYKRRTELWEANNLTTMRAGGPDCVWSGMISGTLLTNSQRFNDLKSIVSKAKIVMLDHQHRTLFDSFEQNTETGKRLHELGGWDKLIPESMPQYMLGSPIFRLAAMPKEEVRLWSFAAFAGGIQPWWHHIGASHDDRRQYKTAEPIFNWHAENEDILLDRTPLADVGIVWSHENHDFFGQDQAQDRTMLPYRGAMKALEAGGITYLPVHVDDMANACTRFRALLLPNVAVMSQLQIDGVQAYFDAGGSVIATGETSLMDEEGALRNDYGLAGLFGVHRLDGCEGSMQKADPHHEVYGRHTYLRLSPELRGATYGPYDKSAPQVAAMRHPVLEGLNDTDILPFGGYLPQTRVDTGVSVIATFIPEFPIYPPETAWMRTPSTNIPAIVTREQTSGGKLVWLLADVDRCYARDEQPDHGTLLINAVRWILGDSALVRIEGSHGFVSQSLYRQEQRQILHLNNRLEVSKIPGRQNDFVPIGPLKVSVQIPEGCQPPQHVDLRVAGKRIEATAQQGRLAFDVDRLNEHEVVVVEWVRSMIAKPVKS